MNRKAEVLRNLAVFILCVGIAAVLWFAGSLLLPSYTIDVLVNDFRAEGATVQVPSEPPSHEGWFPVEPRRFLVNGESIFVYQFRDNLQAFRAALAVEPSGYGIGPIDGTGGVNIEWIAAPRWYRRGQLIVRHVGYHHDVDEILEKYLGSPFAGK